MHILVTNDDGPPSPTSSPYVHSLVRALQRNGHTVSVCLPNTQRSWIGKAHMINQTVKPSYYRPPPDFDPTPGSSPIQGTTHKRPARDADVEEWILLDGTPASCAQIGLHHFFGHRGKIDLVVSGPNYGRNTTAVFALSSGTLGGALEAAVCRNRSIALSYAFFSRNHDPTIIEGASRHSVRVIEGLWRQWPSDGSVDLYSVNVPLVEGVEGHRTLWTQMLQNYWSDASACFEEVEGSIADEDEEEMRIREAEELSGGGNQEGAKDTEKGAVAEGAEGEAKGYTHRHFKWAPRFQDVYRSVEESPPGNDGWAVKEGLTSVTPLKASFWHTATHLHGKELELDTTDSQGMEAKDEVREICLPFRPKEHFYALISYEDVYVQPLILASLEKLVPKDSYTLLSPPPLSSQESESEISLTKLLPSGSGGKNRILQITPYEAIDWEYVEAHRDTCLVNSYMLRKALIRKHYLAVTVEKWVAKRPGSVLSSHFKRGEAFELDYAEFLDDSLVEAFELRASLEKNEEGEDGTKPASERDWWILKPGMSDRGQGIRLFSTMQELQDIFDEWEADAPDSDEEEEEEEEEEHVHNGDGGGEGGAAQKKSNGDEDYLVTSHLRHFVAQPYIHPPLLLDGGRKFHIRTYVLCVGALDVYVYRDMLALSAGRPYVAPWDDHDDLEAHLTNTCLQRTVKDGSVRRFWDLDIASLSNNSNTTSTTAESSPSSSEIKQDIFAQICAITGEVFEAATRDMMMHFRPLPNAFEVYGLDFLVDAQGHVWLLEVNAFPDFRQTGDELRGLVAELWNGVLRLALPNLFETSAVLRCEEKEKEEDKMVHVRHVDLGRQWGGSA